MILVDGRRADSVPVGDRGLAYGDGIFETIAVVDKKLRLLPLHLERLGKGARRLGFVPPPTNLLAAELAGLAAASTAERAVVKLIVTRGDGGRGYDPIGVGGCRRVAQLLPFPPDYRRQATVGVKAEWAKTTLAANPLTAGLKTLNRLEQVLARQKSPPAEELIMCDGDGNVIEAVAANLFMVKDGVVSTPDLSLVGVEGVMRRFVLENCLQLQPKLKVKIRRIAKRELAAADEVFLTNALRGIHPLVQLGNRRYRIGRVTRFFSSVPITPIMY